MRPHRSLRPNSPPTADNPGTVADTLTTPATVSSAELCSLPPAVSTASLICRISSSYAPSTQTTATPRSHDPRPSGSPPQHSQPGSPRCSRSATSTAARAGVDEQTQRRRPPDPSIVPQTHTPSPDLCQRELGGERQTPCSPRSRRPSDTELPHEGVCVVFARRDCHAVLVARDREAVGLDV